MRAFPKGPSFVRQPADTNISEIALRLLVEFPGGETHIVGTALLIGPRLAVTARHNLDDIIERFGAKTVSEKTAVVQEYAVRLYQILPGPQYNIWNVSSAWPCETDIAILELTPHGRTHPQVPVAWVTPMLTFAPLAVGQTVAGFGYHSSTVDTPPQPGGEHHIDLNDAPTVTTGQVEEILPTGNPGGRFTFPCFRVGARFDGGMSGGPVFAPDGFVCGLISGTLGNVDGEPISYVASLWPMLLMMISAKGPGNRPPHTPYAMIDLVLLGTIKAVGLEYLDPSLFLGRILPKLEADIDPTSGRSCSRLGT
jgi:hypothetical protein